MTVDGIIEVFERYRVSCANEKELQRAIAAIFDLEGCEYDREVSLAPGDRIDFLVAGVGIEVKTGGSRTSLLRQLHRYAKHEKIECLLVISSRGSLTSMPETVRGKPIHVLYVGNPF